MTAKFLWKIAMLNLVLIWIEAIAVNAQIPASQVIQKLGYPAGSRLLLIHGDDFGVAHSVNLATEEALEKGWITSASMMVPCSWFPEAAKFAREHPDLDLGLHLTLTTWWDAPWRGADLKVLSSPDFHNFLKSQKFILVTWRQLERAVESESLGKR